MSHFRNLGWKVWVIPWILSSCSEEGGLREVPLFQLVPSSHSSIEFANTLTEDDEFNIIEYLYFYNGGGVALGDINNDGLSDIYFTSNQQPNKLYLNKGDFKFEDITKSAQAEGIGNWKTGVTMADVNGDGWLDIFICGVGNYKSFQGRNQLLINNKDLTFSDRTNACGLAFMGFSTQSAFFDYDLDGDLDMYLLNHSVHTQRSYGRSSLRFQHDSLAGDRLYRNELVPSGETRFVDVTTAAGILNSQIGYGLGISVSDINLDGYPDLYISNDFNENDYLYINQGDGTFRQDLERSMPHTSRFSMGNDIADFNNDGWPDIVTLDMLPRDESVIKTSAGEDSYEVWKFKLKYGYHKQVSRNTLQLSRGLVDSARLLFSDVAPLAGVEATDWSWAPLFFDADGDGWKDLFVSNGIVRRPNDLDYINFISNDSAQKAMETNVLPWVGKMPEGKVSNFIFKNRGDLTFEDKTAGWGMSQPSFSNGAAYGDLDNDGDPDLVVNTINDQALIYRNNSRSSRFLSVTLSGDSTSGNRFGIGALVKLRQNDTQQMQEFSPTRGWCSSSDYKIIFGLQDPAQPADLEITWPDGRKQQITTNDRKVAFFYEESGPAVNSSDAELKGLLKASPGFDFQHNENDFNAMNRESLIPHMHTTEGPPLAIADVNNDGTDDAFVGGGKDQPAGLFIGRGPGKWTQQYIEAFIRDAMAEDVDASFLDADGDGDMDLVVVSGGQEEMSKNEAIRPRLYLNNGQGDFKRSEDAFPEIYLNASCIAPADFDLDGDVDIFIGASVMPFLYGMSPVSYLLRNDGAGHFSLDTGWLGQSRFDNPTKVRPGMVKDAAWTNLNGDDLPDLILVGEWMPITILIQQPDHRFENRTNSYGMSKTRGWWNSITTGDFDDDGDEDWVVGNLGLNTRLHVTPERPLTMYLGDFDSNGSSDHILVYFNGASSFPLASRDQFVKQLPLLKKKFPRYIDYRNVILEDIITPQQKGNSAVMQVDFFESVFIRNEKDSLFIKALPMEAQLFPVYAIEKGDVNEDGRWDLIIGGNLTATQPELGPYDAGLGLVLIGDGKGDFRPLVPAESGFVVKGEIRDIKVMKEASSDEKIFIVSRNNQSVLFFKTNVNETH